VAWPPEALAQMSGISDGFRTGGADAVAAGLLDMLLGEPDIHDDWLRSWREQPNDRLADAVTVLMGVDDIAVRLSEVTQPALIVHGEADKPMPLQFGQMLHDALPQAIDLVVIPGAGHTPSLTHADQVNPALSAFLRQYA
jgi:3-oxoadipate enol-lactonase